MLALGDQGVDEVGDEMTGGDVICCNDGCLDWEMNKGDGNGDETGDWDGDELSDGSVQCYSDSCWEWVDRETKEVMRMMMK